MNAILSFPSVLFFSSALLSPLLAETFTAPIAANVSVECSSHGMNVSWNEPTDGWMITGYCVEVKQVGRTNCDTNSIVSRYFNICVNKSSVYEENGVYLVPIRDLTPATYYHVTVVSEVNSTTGLVEFCARTLFAIHIKPTNEKISPGIIIMICVLLIILAVLLILLPIKLKKKKKLKSHFDRLPLKNISTTGSFSGQLSLKDLRFEELNFRNSVSRIPVKTLETHVAYMLHTGGMEREYHKIKRGKMNPCLIASAPENSSKNRYRNILAYDHSRVVLLKWPENFSEYINANYIDGYLRSKKYIAAQGPKQNTILDFWKMIWQINISTIVMVTSVTENEKEKCAKYWPETTAKYGSVVITLQHTEEFDDFIIRMFKISRGNSTRNVKHFQFLSWHSGDVPSFISPVVKFLFATRSYQPNTRAPILVHCSAGVGRTGTIIAIDIMLDMAEEEQHIDLFNCVKEMRKQRVNMIETIDQYALAYQVLVEALCKENTSIPCNEFQHFYGKLQHLDTSRNQTYVEMQFQELKKLHFCCKITENLFQHQVTKISRLKALSKRISLRRSGPSTSATGFINGYRRKNEFVIQIPNISPANFWKMIYQGLSRTVVLMHNLKHSKMMNRCYWPVDSVTCYGDYIVTPVSNESTESGIVIRTFKISKIDWMINKADEYVVKQFHLEGWDPGEVTPPSATVILELIQKTEEWKQYVGNHLTTVQCINGVSGSGMFCAAACVCKKMKMEKFVDVFEAVQNVRLQNSQFVESTAQYSFLYDVAYEYLLQLSTYTNFR